MFPLILFFCLSASYIDQQQRYLFALFLVSFWKNVIEHVLVPSSCDDNRPHNGLVFIFNFFGSAFGSHFGVHNSAHFSLRAKYNEHG